jgi:hypothetical protein
MFTDEVPEIGNTNTISLENNDDKYLLITRNSPGFGEEIVCNEYDVSKEDFYDIENYIKSNNIPSYNKLPESEEHVLDGPSRFINIAIDDSNIGKSNHEIYSISYELDIPREGYDILNGLINKLKLLIKKNNKINEYIERDE